MDCVAEGHWQKGDKWIDVSLRVPMADHYQPQAQTIAGFALARADQDKQTRYPPKNGLFCTTCAVECFGRLSQGFVDFLHECADQANSRRLYWGIRPQRLRGKWELQLSRLLVAQNTLAVERSARSAEKEAVSSMSQ